MKLTHLAIALMLASVAFSSAQAADDMLFLQLATCRDSWSDWKHIAPKVTPFQDRIAAHLRRIEGAEAHTPIKALSLLDFNVVDVYPGGVTMGLGFSGVVEAEFDSIKMSLENHVGKRITECSLQENTRDCGCSFAEKSSDAHGSNERKERDDIVQLLFLLRQMNVASTALSQSPATFHC